MYGNLASDINKRDRIELSPTWGEYNLPTNYVANDDGLLYRDRESQGPSQVESKSRIEEPPASTSGSRREIELELMAKVLVVLEKMDKRLETLEKNSKLDHEDRPFPKHDLDKHDPVWRSVYETFNTTMKDKVEKWKSGMDSSLIFVGLFVTIITAFLVPVSQNLAPNPSDLTNALLTNLTTIIYDIAVMNGLRAPSNLAQPETFHPALSDEIISLFLYSALLLSLITAIFSVFGRQWAEHLTNKPKGQAYSEKVQRLDRRDELAIKYLKPILDSLHPILIFSIAFFIVGLLYQLWTMSLTVDKSVALIFTSSFGSGLILCATIATVGTVLHGGYCEESPFTMATSGMIRRLIPKCLLKDFEVKVQWNEFVRLFCKSITQMDSRDNYDHLSTVRLFKKDKDKEDEDSGYAKPDASTVDSVVHFLGSDASQKAKSTMAWNLLDIRELEEEDFKKLGNSLTSLEKDTPSNHDKDRLGSSFIRMVLFLRLNKERFDITAESSFSDMKEMKEVFLKALTQEGENNKLAEILKRLAGKDPHFLDNIKDELLDAILTDDKGGREDWRIPLYPVLRHEDVTLLLRRISLEFRNSEFHLKILYGILDKRKDSPHLLKDSELFQIFALLEYGGKKKSMANKLAELAGENPCFLDSVRNRLFDLILIDDNPDWDHNWRESILRILSSVDVAELLRRVSQKTENHLFYYKILCWIFLFCKEPLPIPDDFNLYNFIIFLSTYEDRYKYLTGFYESPSLILFFYCDLMDDALLSRQTGLSEYFKEVSSDARANSWTRNRAASLLARLPRNGSIQTAVDPEKHEPSASVSPGEV